VKNITEYGVFIDLGGIDGLLHITDMSWGRISHPSELFMIGDKVDVVILKYDKENERVSLGYKQKTPDPWGRAEERYPVGKKVRGKVVSITEYGAFVELEEGVEGLRRVVHQPVGRRLEDSQQGEHPRQQHCPGRGDHPANDGRRADGGGGTRIVQRSYLRWGLGTRVLLDRAVRRKSHVPSLRLGRGVQ